MFAGAAPSLIRRDAVMFARLHRAGDLTGVWVPDAVHEGHHGGPFSVERVGEDRATTARPRPRPIRCELFGELCLRTEQMRHHANKRPKEVHFGHMLASAVEPSVPNRIEHTPIDTLRPNSRNSRTHSKSKFDRLRRASEPSAFCLPLSSMRGASFSQETAVFRPHALKVSLTCRSSGSTTSRRRKNAPT
jgi:hypothetical protein